MAIFPGISTWLRDGGHRQSAWGTFFLLVALFWISWYLKASAGQFPRTNGALIIVVVLAAVIAAAVCLREKPGGAWLLGLLLVSGVPMFLLLALGIVPEGETREGIRGLVYLYVAGAFGGLVLELLQERRYCIELPSVTLDNQGGGVRVDDGRGRMWRIGFLSRVLVGGLAGLALVTVVGTLADSSGFLFTTKRPGATEPDGLVWALLAGSVAPAGVGKARQAGIRPRPSCSSHR